MSHHQQQQNNSFDDPLSLSLGGTFDGQPSDYINDNTPVIFDYDESTATGVPLSLNGMLSSDESLVGLVDPLANLDDMDASSAAAAAASLDAFLADQPSMSMPMMPSNMMPTPQVQQQQHHYGGGMQLAAGYPMMMPQQQQQQHVSLPPRGGRAVGGQTQNMAATHSLFHYPMTSSASAGVYPGTAAPRQQQQHQQQAMASYPGMGQPMMLQTPVSAAGNHHNQQHIAYGEVSSPPSYGYPMASYPGTTPNMTSVAMVSTPPPTASLSAIPSSPSSSVSVASPVVTSMSSPQQQSQSPPSIHTVESTTVSPSSPVSPTSGSASDDGESVRVTKDNRKRKNRGGGGSGANNNGKDDDDDDDQSKKPVTEEEMQESKRQQRLMRNRASAQLSRERKKVYMKKLEGQLKELQNQNAALSQQLIALKNENAALRARSETLPTSSGYVYGSGAYPGSPSSVSSDGSASPEYGYTPAPSYTHGVNSNGNGHKRTRLSSNHSSAHHQMYQLPPRVRAAGVVMFALMMSFTIFYNMAGIDFNQVKTESEFTPSDHQSTVVFHNRGLKTSDESSMVTTEDLPSSATGDLRSIPSPRRLVQFPGSAATSQLAYTTPNAGNNDSEAAASYALVKKEHPMTPVITSDAPVVVVKHEPVAASNEDKAVDLWLYENDDTTSSDDDSSSVHSHNAATAPLATDFELFQQWKKMIVDSNLTLDMGSSYMFCPSAIQMRPQAPAKASTTKVYPHEESGIAGRLRRAGLPLPNATAAETLEELSSARLSPSNNRLRLWVPTQSVLAGGDWDTSAFSHDAQSKLSGLTEIECQVSGIRPVIIANTATATA